MKIVNLEQGDSRKTVKIESKLKERLKKELVHCLQFHSDVFAWTHDDMPRINPKVACHKLAIKNCARPVRQKGRYFN